MYASHYDFLLKWDPFFGAWIWFICDISIKKQWEIEREKELERERKFHTFLFLLLISKCDCYTFSYLYYIFCFVHIDHTATILYNILYVDIHILCSFLSAIISLTCDVMNSDRCGVKEEYAKHQTSLRLCFCMCICFDGAVSFYLFFFLRSKDIVFVVIFV